LSPDGKTWLILEEDGNLVLATAANVIWAAASNKNMKPETHPKSGALLANGELVLYSPDGKKVVWSSGNKIDQDAQDTTLIVQNDGHVAIFANASRIWYTSRKKSTDTPSDTLAAGEFLEPEQPLISKLGKYKLMLTSSGSLEIREVATGKVVWGDKKIVAPKGKMLTMRDDDNLTIDPDFAWTSKTRRRKYGGTATLSVNDSGSADIKSEGVRIWMDH
jgi:hypothetical protein